MTLRKDKILQQYINTLEDTPKGKNLTKIYAYTRWCSESAHSFKKCMNTLDCTPTPDYAFKN